MQDFSTLQRRQEKRYDLQVNLTQGLIQTITCALQLPFNTAFNEFDSINLPYLSLYISCASACIQM